MVSRRQRSVPPRPFISGGNENERLLLSLMNHLKESKPASVSNLKSVHDEWVALYGSSSFATPHDLGFALDQLNRRFSMNNAWYSEENGALFGSVVNFLDKDIFNESKKLWGGLNPLPAVTTNTVNQPPIQPDDVEEDRKFIKSSKKDLNLLLLFRHFETTTTGPLYDQWKVFYGDDHFSSEQDLDNTVNQLKDRYALNLDREIVNSTEVMDLKVFEISDSIWGDLYHTKILDGEDDDQNQEQDDDPDQDGDYAKYKTLAKRIQTTQRV